MGNDVVLSLSFFKLEYYFLSLSIDHLGLCGALMDGIRRFTFALSASKWKNDGFDKIAELNITTYFFYIHRKCVSSGAIRWIFVNENIRRFLFRWHHNKRKWLIIYSFDDNLCWHINRLHVRWDCVDCCWLASTRCFQCYTNKTDTLPNSIQKDR